MTNRTNEDQKQRPENYWRRYKLKTKKKKKKIRKKDSHD